MKAQKYSFVFFRQNTISTTIIPNTTTITATNNNNDNTKISLKRDISDS